MTDSAQGSGLAAARSMKGDLTIADVRAVLEEIGAEKALKNQEAFRTFIIRKDEKIAMAAQLLRESTVADKCGLAEVLAELAKTVPLPPDVTTWLCSRLRSFHPAELPEYPNPVLKGLLMKCDEFENIHLLKTERPHPEVWNFRKTETADLPVYGSGQCHLDGLLYLAKDLKGKGYDKVLWFNMREEPVVFLDGQACAPRSAHNMNENVEHLTGIEGRELAAIEKRLRDDCVEAAAGQTMPVFYQVGAGDNVEKQLKVPLERSFPVFDAYDWLNKQEGVAQLTYSRVPIADETAPEEADFDQLVNELKTIACKGVSSGTALVFNCQMGRGRTTTGMVCGSILLLAARGWTAPPDAPKKLPEPTAQERDRKRGEFASILELLRLVDGAALSSSAAAAGMKTEGRGLNAKLLVDQCCDDCGHAQNMVEAIVQCTDAAGKAEPGAARSPEFWKRRAQHYLERYAYILLFAAYALEDVHSSFERSFSEWSRSHWQFKRIIKHQTLA